MELTANGNMFNPIVKLFGTWILRKRLAEWTFKFHHNNMESRPYTYCAGTKVPTQKPLLIVIASAVSCGMNVLDRQYIGNYWSITTNNGRNKYSSNNLLLYTK